MAAPSIKWREATELGADGVVPLERPASNSFGTTPPAQPFLEFDGLAGTPPNSGGSFKRATVSWFTPSPAWGYILLPLHGALKAHHLIYSHSW